MKVLVTGGAGYLGSVLCQHLVLNHHQVRVLDKGYWGFDHLLAAVPSVVILAKDIREVEVADLDGVDAVIHLAGLSNDPTAEFSPEANQAVNVDAVARLWECCEGVDRPMRVLCASTASLYDGVVEFEAQETMKEVCLKYPYSRSKYDAEQLLFQIAGRNQRQRISATVLRMATLWGLSPRMRSDLAINAMVLSALTKGQITVHCDGMQWRPMCHVLDAARAYNFVLQEPGLNGHIVNVVAENWLLLDLAHRVARAVSTKRNEPVQVQVTYGQERRRSYRVSGEKLRTTTVWTPSYDLWKGIEQVVDAWNKQGYPDPLRSSNIAWMEHLVVLEPFFRANREVL